MKAKIAEIDVPNQTYGYVYDMKCLETIQEQILNKPLPIKVNEEVVGLTQGAYIEDNSLYVEIKVTDFNIIEQLNMSYKPVGWHGFLNTHINEPTLVDADKIDIDVIRGIPNE